MSDKEFPSTDDPRSANVRPCEAWPELDRVKAWLVRHEHVWDETRVNFAMMSVTIGGLRKLFESAIQGLQSAESSPSVEGNSLPDGCMCHYRGDVEDISGCPIHAPSDVNRDADGAQE